MTPKYLFQAHRFHAALRIQRDLPESGAVSVSSPINQLLNQWSNAPPPLHCLPMVSSTWSQHAIPCYPILTSCTIQPYALRAVDANEGVWVLGDHLHPRLRNTNPAAPFKRCRADTTYADSTPPSRSNRSNSPAGAIAVDMFVVSLCPGPF
jgi:hypothetical protein